MSVRVTLSSADLRWAREIGELRLKTAEGAPKFSYASTGRSGKETHTLGAMGELAFCRAFGLVWPARNNVGRREVDVDPAWEVRWAGNPRQVKVAANDPPDRLVAHVTGQPPTFEVWGFIRAAYVQRHVPATDPGGRGNKAHFAPAYWLAPLEPDSHVCCQWWRRDGTWECMFCGETY